MTTTKGIRSRFLLVLLVLLKMSIFRNGMQYAIPPFFTIMSRRSILFYDNFRGMFREHINSITG